MNVLCKYTNICSKILAWFSLYIKKEEEPNVSVHILTAENQDLLEELFRRYITR